MKMKSAEKIGGGARKEAYVLNADTVRLTMKGTNRWKEQQVQSIYLIQNLGHILFPDNIPAVKEVGQENGRAFVDVAAVPLDAVHISFAEAKKKRPRQQQYNAHEIEYYRRHRIKSSTLDAETQLLRNIRNAGLLDVDDRLPNFSHAEGKIRYLDFEPAWVGKKLYVDPARLKKAIESLEDKNQKAAARTLFNRLIKLIPAELLNKI